jgi:O-antigen ligase
LGFLAFTHRPARKYFWMAIIGGILVLVILSPETLKILSGTLRLRGGLSGREDIWPMALRTIFEHPFFGLGPSWFEQRFFFLSPLMTNGLYSAISKPSAHNAFLTIGTDLGFFASLLSLAIFALFATRTRALWSRLKNTPDFGILAGISALVLAGFMRALFETDTILPYRYFTINSLLIALLAIQDRLYTREFPPS